ncbi:MAG: hypothetical protein ACP5I8_13735 [Phycisphaerae bacterium]
MIFSTGTRDRAMSMYLTDSGLSVHHGEQMGGVGGPIPKERKCGLLPVTTLQPVFF